MASSTSELLTKGRLTELLKREVADCQLDEADLQKISQITSMRWATVKFDGSPDTMRVVLKESRGGDPRSITYGTAREGFFYQQWRQLPCAVPAGADLLAALMPTVFFAEGDMATGAKRILMEDLSSCVQAGYFFGGGADGGNPNNWGKDLAKERARLPDASALNEEAVVRLCFSAAAKLHAAFWRCDTLIGSEEFGWLHGSDWLAGRGKDAWEASQAEVKSFWDQTKPKAEGWDPLIVGLLDAAVAKTDWMAYQQEVQVRAFTLKHGDFHPANFLLRPEHHDLVWLDWEIVGLGSGPQDLGQFMISHVEPALREQLEEAAVRHYFEELLERNPSVSMTWEQCWAEYVQGGLGRWLWFLPMLGAWCPPKMAKYFHDQVLAFAKTHGVTEANVPMPRA